MPGPCGCRPRATPTRLWRCWTRWRTAATSPIARGPRCGRWNCGWRRARSTPRAAADALDKLLYAWRGDDRELALRERVAALRAQTGGWREALSGLRQAETDFPDQAAAVHDRLKDTFAGIIRDQDIGKMPPLDFVSMVDENADLISGPDDEDAIAQPLADRLVALDLPGRAKPLLEKLMRSAATDAGKARLGASLARLLSRENDDAGALAALDASEAPGLPADLVEQRTILRANATGAAGRRGGRGGDPGSAEDRSGGGGAGADPGERRRLGGRGSGLGGVRRPDRAGERPGG